MALCTVCSRVIPNMLLMCSKHWRLVPPAEQDAVYKTFGASRRISPTDPTAWAKACKDYRDACTAATAAAKAAARSAGEQLPRGADVAEFAWRI